MEAVSFEYISFSVRCNGVLTIDQFINTGVRSGWYGEYGYGGQRMLLEKAYELIREQYEKLLPLIV